MAQTGEDRTGLNSNDLLFNLTLVTGVCLAIYAGLNGTGVGTAFLYGLGVFGLGLPVLLALSWAILRPFGRQDWHAGLANVFLILALLGIIALSVMHIAGA